MNKSPKKKREQRSPSNSKKPTDIYDDNLNKLKAIAQKLQCPQLLEFFEPTSSTDNYICEVCPKSPKIPIVTRKNLKRHITHTEIHFNSLKGTSQEEKHNELVQKIKQKQRIKLANHAKDQVQSSFVRFVVCCSKAKISFNQISILGEFLKEMYINGELGFLKHSSFDPELISKAITFYGQSLKEDLEKDLSQNNYSVSIDTTTIGGINICALQAKYLKEIITEQNIKKVRIQNRVVGIKYMAETSTGEEMYRILKEKLLDLNSEIKQNLLSIVHDHASSLSSLSKGLVGHLKSDFSSKFVFDMNDPCHSLNLAISHSIDSLPDEVMDLIDHIHSHFSKSPQRIATLMRVQKEGNLNELALKRYIRTRWLSLGSCLRRLLEVWDGVILYLKEPKVMNFNKKKIENFIELFTDDFFKLKIQFLACIITKIDSINITFQNQHLKIHDLLLSTRKCIKEIACLLLKPAIIPEHIGNIKEDLLAEDNLKLDDDFLDKIALELNSKFKITKNHSNKNKINAFITFCKNFLKTLLVELLNYLPINDKVIQTLDFVCLPSNDELFKQKICEFNDIFHLIDSDEDKNKLIEEINDLYSKDITWVRLAAGDSTLLLWQLLETKYYKIDISSKEKISKFPLLSKFMSPAQSLATSSANVEQSFSTIKLYKTDLRNQLKEETLQALILIDQEPSTRAISISKRTLDLYKEAIENLNSRKSGSQTSINSVNLMNEKPQANTLKIDYKKVSAPKRSSLEAKSPLSEEIQPRLTKLKLTSNSDQEKESDDKE